MPIFKLTPKDLKSPHWRLSTHKGVAVVRAPDEKAARFEATNAFAIAEAILSRETLYNPWSQSAMVACEPIEYSTHPDEGPSGLLWPMQ